MWPPGLGGYKLIVAPVPHLGTIEREIHIYIYIYRERERDIDIDIETER